MKRPAAKLTRTAFTLIEMLIVIAVILILVSIGVTGFRSMELSAARKQTVTTLASANSMVRELAATGASNRLYGPSSLIPVPIFKDTDAAIASPGDVNVGQGGRTTAITAEQKVMQLLLSVPKNTQMVTALPPQATVAPVSGTPLKPPVLADAWGNPLMYVGPAGMSGLTVNGVTGQTVKSTGSAGTTVTPQDRGFWMSAGPDGNFTTYDDNIISVQP